MVLRRQKITQIGGLSILRRIASFNSFNCIHILCAFTLHLLKSGYDFIASELVNTFYCNATSRIFRWNYLMVQLTHWGRVTHICDNKLTIIGSDNGLSPDRRQAIIWTNAGILLIGPLKTNFSEILIEILTFSFKKIRLKVSPAKRRPFCLGLNVLMKTWCSISGRYFISSTHFGVLSIVSKNKKVGSEHKNWNLSVIGCDVNESLW